MATYKALKGLSIQTVAGDIGTVQLGDIWYNSTLGKIRVGKTTAGSWASSPAMNTARAAAGSGGTATAALAAGGEVPPATANCEIYNGTSWTEVANLNDARYNMSSGTVGTTAAGLGIGGDQPGTKG